MADDERSVLGLATAVSGGALVVHRVVVRLSGAGVELTMLDAWRATRKDEARSLADLAEALANSLDPKRKGGAPEAVAIKRVEMPFRKPPTTYDQRTRAEAAAMIAATGQGARYFGYRANEIKARGRALREAASRHPECPGDDDRRDAIDAACAALADLNS